MAVKKIQSTKNYRLFKRDDDNRTVDVKKHKSLLASMKQYGFLSCFPIVAHRNGAKQMSVKDGQHRLTIAEMLGLPVYWIEDDGNFDIAMINSTAKVWVVNDYAHKFATNGKKDYQELLEFAEANRIPTTLAAGILSGQSGWGHFKAAFCSGTWKITNREWAAKVANVYVTLTDMSKEIRNVRFLQACIAACRVEDFDEQRLLHNAKRCREKLLAYSTRDAYLDMIEDVYNFGRAKLFGIKAAALQAMRNRDVVRSKARKNGKA